ncbi:MAG: hypothetical protein R3F60_16780 [bacterium]
MDEGLPEEVRALAFADSRDFDHDGLAAEAHCRYRGRRLCTTSELQHWNQCVMMQSGQPSLRLALGCHAPFTRADIPRLLPVVCEFVDEMTEVVADRIRLVHAIVGLRVDGSGWLEVDERGYPQLYRAPNDAIWCNGGNPGTRCCLDL